MLPSPLYDLETRAVADLQILRTGNIRRVTVSTAFALLQRNRMSAGPDLSERITSSCFMTLFIFFFRTVWHPVLLPL